MYNADKLEKLLADLGRLNAEKKQLEKTAADLQAEQKRLMETIDVENKTEFEKVCKIDMRLKILPNKMRVLSTEIGSAEWNLKSECIDVTSGLHAKISDKLTELTHQIAKVLIPFFDPRRTPKTEAENFLAQYSSGTFLSPANVAEKIVSKSDSGSVLVRLRVELVNENFQNWPPVRKANALLSAIKVLNAVEI